VQATDAIENHGLAFWLIQVLPDDQSPTVTFHRGLLISERRFGRSKILISLAFPGWRVGSMKE